MLTLEFGCIPVMGKGVFVSKTYPNRLNKVQEICYHRSIFVKYKHLAAHCGAILNNFTVV